MEKQLFSDFAPVTRRQWIDKMIQDLKGRPYEKLIWESPEGIPVEPAYSREDTKDLSLRDGQPGKFPFHRGYHTRQSWIIGQDITVQDPKEANKQALLAIKGGAEALGFIYPDIPDPCIGMDGLLENIELEKVPVFFENSFHPYTLFTGLKQALSEAGVSPASFHGAVSFDPLGFLTVHGDYPSTEKDTFFSGREILEEAGELFPHLRTLAVHADIFNNAGGTAVHEIGYALATGNEYLSYYTKEGIPIDNVANHILFLFAVSGNFFMEIAKLRAFRMLWSIVMKTWEPEKPEHLTTHIHATTALRNKTLYDPYVNILRTTTESMSAILGGANSLTVRPYDMLLKGYREPSARLARNIQLILKNETRLHEVTDAVAGAYYIEKLTRQLADKAWKLFQEVEKEGGYRKALKNENIQQALSDSLEKRLMNIAARKEILVGTNHYPNPQERVTDEGSMDHLGMSWSPGRKLIRPIDIRRLGEEIESLRLTTELAQKKPVVYLLGFGSPAVRNNRENFVLNLIGCAGFSFTETAPGATPGEHIKEINRIHPDLVVLCGDDEGYPEMTEKLKKELTYKPILAIAGLPEKNMETLKIQGIHFFLHQKVDLPETLRDLQKALNLIQ